MTDSTEALLAELAAYRGEIEVIAAQLDDEGRAVLDRLRICPRLVARHVAAERGWDDDEAALDLAAMVAPIAAVAPEWVRCADGRPWVDFGRPGPRAALDLGEARAFFDDCGCFAYPERAWLRVGPTDPMVDPGCSTSVTLDPEHLEVMHDDTHPVTAAPSRMALLDSLCLRIGIDVAPVAPPAPARWPAQLDDPRGVLELLTDRRAPSRPPAELLAEMLDDDPLYQLGRRRARASGWRPGQNRPWSMSPVEPEEDDEEPVPGAVERMLGELTGRRRALLAMLVKRPVPIVPGVEVGGRRMVAVELLDRAGWIVAYSLAAAGRPLVGIDDEGRLVLRADVPADLVAARAPAPAPTATRKAKPAPKKKPAAKGRRRRGTKSRPPDAAFDLFAEVAKLRADGAVSGGLIPTPWGARIAGFTWRPTPYAGPRSPLWGAHTIEGYRLQVCEVRPGSPGFDEGHRYRVQHRGDNDVRVTSWPVTEGVDPIYALQRVRAYIEGCPGAGLAPPRGEELLAAELRGKKFNPGRGDAGRGYAYIPTVPRQGRATAEPPPSQGTATVPPAPEPGPRQGPATVPPAPDLPARLPAGPAWTLADLADELGCRGAVRRVEQMPDRLVCSFEPIGRCVVEVTISPLASGVSAEWSTPHAYGSTTVTDGSAADVADRLLRRFRCLAPAPALSAPLALPAPGDETPWSHGDGRRAARAVAVLARLRPELRLHSYAHPCGGATRRVRWNCRRGAEHCTVSTSSPIRAVRMALWGAPATLPAEEPIALPPPCISPTLAGIVLDRPTWAWWIASEPRTPGRDLGDDLVGELSAAPLDGAVLYGATNAGPPVAMAAAWPTGWAALTGAAARRFARDDAPIARWAPAGRWVPEAGDFGLVDTCPRQNDQAARWAARAAAQTAGEQAAAGGPLEMDWRLVDPAWWVAAAAQDLEMAEQLRAAVPGWRDALARLPVRGPTPSPAIVGPAGFEDAWAQRSRFTVDRQWGVRARKGRQGRKKGLTLEAYVQARATFAAAGGDPDNNAHVRRYLAEQGAEVSRQTVIRRRRELEALSAGALAEIETEAQAQGLAAVAALASPSTAIASGSLSPLIWVGGKGRMLDELLDEFPAEPFDYCEPFLGGATLYLALAAAGRIRRARLGEADPDIAAFWQAVKADPDAVYENAAGWGWHQYAAALAAIDICQGIDRAGAVLRVNRQARNGLWRRRREDGGLNMPPGVRAGQRDIGITRAALRRVSELLQPAEIVCADAEALIDELDAGWWVYADPPYWPLSKTANFAGYDGRGFQAGDLVRTIAALRRLEQRGGHAVLSNASTAPVQALVEAAGGDLRWASAYRSVSRSTSTRGVTPEILARWGVAAGAQARAA